MKTKILAVRDKLQALDDRIETKAEAMRKENDAKLNKLNEQIAKAV